MVAAGAAPRGPSVLANGRALHVAAAAQIVKLLFEERPYLFIDDVTMHARLASGVVDVVMMAIDAADRRVIEMSKRHRQYRFGAAVVVRRDDALTSNRRSKGKNPDDGRKHNSDGNLHSAVPLLTATNTATPTALTSRNARGEALPNGRKPSGRATMTAAAISEKRAICSGVCR